MCATTTHVYEKQPIPPGPLYCIHGQSLCVLPPPSRIQVCAWQPQTSWVLYCNVLPVLLPLAGCARAGGRDLLPTRSTRRALRLLYAVAARTINLVVQLDCLQIFMPLQRLICFRGDRLTIRQQCGHVQAFEGSTSGALLVDVGHRPAFLAGTPDHFALDVWHGLGVLVAPRLRLALPNRKTASTTVDYCCTVLYPTVLCDACCTVCAVLYWTVNTVTVHCYCRQCFHKTWLQSTVRIIFVVLYNCVLVFTEQSVVFCSACIRTRSPPRGFRL